MYAGSRVEGAGIRFGQCNSIKAALIAAARDDHFDDSGIGCPLHYLDTIVIETVVGQISADVDEWMTQSRYSVATICRPEVSKGYIVSMGCDDEQSSD